MTKLLFGVSPTDATTFTVASAIAEPLLLGSYKNLKSSQSADSPRIRRAAERLVTLYTDWGKPSDANNFRNW